MSSFKGGCFVADDERGMWVKTEIIFEDKDILVAYKPAGLATQTARVGQQDMVSELKNYLWQKRVVTGAALGRPAPYLGVVHRLDQPVEGILVFAKNASTASALTEQLGRQGEAGMFHKRYYGVLCGKPAEMEGELSDYLYKNKENMAVIVEGETLEQNKGLPVKKAVLHYRVLEVTNRPETLTLADIHIFTGRFHQIRAQMAHGGTPLLGDVKYGGEEAKAMAKALRIPNVALCAYCMEFPHPFTGEKMSFRIKPRGRAFSFFSQ